MSIIQPFQLDARTLGLTDVIPTQSASGGSDVGKNTPQEIFNLTASLSTRTAALTDVIATQISDGSTPTGKNAIGDYQSLILGYKNYCGVLSQTGTAIPTVDIANNTLGGVITYVRNSAGIYVGTAPSGSLPLNLTFTPTMNQQIPVADRTVFMFQSNADEITIIVRKISDASFVDLGLSDSVTIQFIGFNS